MEEFFIKKIKAVFLFLMICTITSCKTSDASKIPQKIIFESSKFIINRYNRNISKNIYIIKNDLTGRVDSFKIDRFNFEMSNQLPSTQMEISTIEFYKFSRITNGDIEVEIILLPRKQYIKLYFAKSGDEKWIRTDEVAWQN